MGENCSQVIGKWISVRLKNLFFSIVYLNYGVRLLLLGADSSKKNTKRRLYILLLINDINYSAHTFIYKCKGPIFVMAETCSR